MASVQYKVLGKYVHPVTKKAVTNLTPGKYDVSNRFVKAYASAAAVKMEEIIAEQSPENQKFDMIFVYSGILDVNSLLDATVPLTQKVMVEKFERCKGDAWFVASKHSSLQSALLAAEPLVKSLGKEYVQVVKNVPLDITVGIE